jgi:hypothetical protein
MSIMDPKIDPVRPGALYGKGPKGRSQGSTPIYDRMVLDLATATGSELDDIADLVDPDLKRHTKPVDCHW